MGPVGLELFSHSDHLFWIGGVEVKSKSGWAGVVWTEEVGGGLTHNFSGLDLGKEGGAELTVGGGDGWNGTGGKELLEVGAGETEEDGFLDGGTREPVDVAATAAAEGRSGGRDGGDEGKELEHFVI